MTRKALVFSIIAIILGYAGMAFSVTMEKTMPIPPKQAIIGDDQPLPELPYYPSTNLITDSPGVLMGETQYDYQSNGSSGHRIVLDSQGGIHVAWMKGMPYPSTRHIFYNCITAGGSPFPGVGGAVSYRTGAGYTQLDMTSDDRAAIVYHHAATGQETLKVAIDAFTCLGQFDYHSIPTRMGSNVILWPYIAVDRSGRIHVTGSTTGTAGSAQPIGYTRSTDGGITWSTLARVDTVEDIATIVVASMVSDKVAIAYTHSTDTSSQWLNDVYYVQSTDGVTWDFRNGKVNVTHYGTGGDSLFAYTDLAAVYDYNDDLHFIWNAQYVTDNGIYYNGKLLHYDVASGTIHQIAQFDSTWPSAGCEFGVWNFVYAKMSVAVDQSNNIFTTYTSWDTSDCSAGGYANGDLYMRYSRDHGVTWSDAFNMTNSHTPACEPGDCDSDHWSSMAEVVDTALHVFYINDKDAGGVVQTEGVVTDNPMLYLAYAPPSAVDGDVETPKSFTLSQNYPNPFNARTNINFELAKASRVELSVYDISGAKVATLVNRNLEAGSHQVNWDANTISSGVYYYTLKTNAGEITKKMTLLK
jgi:hypothetical protein